MNGEPGPADESRGSLSPAEGAGTPVPVDVSGDVATRWIWAVFLAGPVIWFSHFMVVYLVAEAGCTGAGMGLRVLDPPVPVIFTLASTVLAVAAAGAAAVWAFRHWRRNVEQLQAAPDDVEDLAGEYDDDRRRGTLAFVGFVLSSFSILAILFTGAPALVLGPC